MSAMYDGKWLRERIGERKLRVMGRCRRPVGGALVLMAAWGMKHGTIVIIENPPKTL